MAGNVAADLLVHVGADVKDAQAGLNQIGKSVTSAGGGFVKAGALMGVASAGIIGGLGAAVMSAMDYEQGIANITALGGEFANSQKEIGNLAMQIGKDTAFSATEGAAAIEELAKAGVPLADIMGGAAMQTANLAAAGGQSMPDAAATMSNAMNMFGIAGSDAAHVADSFAAAANASASDVSGLAQALSQGGPAAAQMGMSLDETNAALALFSNYGIQGSDAGTSLKTMLTSLANPSGEAAQAMADLGISAFDAQGNFIGMEGLAGQLQTALGGLTQEQQAAALATIFGSDASRVAAVLMKEGAAGVREMEDAVKDQGAAGRMAAAKMNTLRGALDQLQGSFETGLIVIGSMFIPVIRMVADSVTGLLNKFLALSPGVQKFIGIAALFAAGLLAAGAAIAFLIGGIGTIIGVVASLAVGFVGIIAVMAALAAGGYIIYKLFGSDIAAAFQTVKEAFSSVMDVVGPFISAMVAAGTGTGEFNEKLAALPKWLQPAARQIGIVVDAVQNLVSAFKAGGLEGLMDALPAQLDRMAGAFGRLGEILLGAFQSIDWGAVGSAVWSGITSALAVLANVGMEIVSYLGDLATTLGTWLWEQASAVDWGGVLSSAAGTAGDITATIVSKLGNLYTALSTWITTAATGLPWSSIGSTATNIVSTVITALGDFGTGLKTWYDNAINSVNWGGMGVTVGEKIGSLATTLAPKALELITGFTNAITENWQTIGTVIAGLVLGLPAMIGYLGLTLGPKALEFIAGFVTGLGINWPLVTDWLSGLPGKALAAVPGLADTLLTKGQELISGILAGLVAYWPDVSTWLANLGTAALSAIPSVAQSLLAKGQELISGILAGLVAYWPDVSTWLGQVGLWAFEAIGDLVGTLLSRGFDLIVGLGRGIREYWPEVSSWLGTVATQAFTAVGSLIATLTPRGVELIKGAVTGLENHWPTMRAWLANITNTAFTAVGSLASTLLSRGIELLQGLKQGAAERWTAVQSDLAAIPWAAYNAVGYLGDALYARGTELLTGLKNGIQDAGEQALQAARDIVSNVVGIFSDIPGFSPIEHVGLLRGSQLAGGFSEGLLDMLPDTRKAANKVIDSALSSFDMLDPRNSAYGRSSTFSQVNPGGSGTTIQYISIDARFDDVEDMVKAAEFVKELNPTRQLYFTGSAS